MIASTGHGPDPICAGSPEATRTSTFFFALLALNNWINWLALNNWIRRLLFNRRRSSSRGSYWGNYLDNACQPTEPEGTIAGAGDPPCSFSGKRIYKTTPARHVR